MPNRAGIPCSQGFFGQDLDDITIFGMNHCEQAKPAGNAHHLEYIAIA